MASVTKISVRLFFELLIFYLHFKYYNVLYQMFSVNKNIYIIYIHKVRKYVEQIIIIIEIQTIVQFIL